VLQHYLRSERDPGATGCSGELRTAGRAIGPGALVSQLLSSHLLSINH